ncbi:MAG: hypothetical protein MUE96_06360 [Bacteroidia bacterium]|jgi:hypothetical protein|nr:hypothetical protein [Bacteroidia bacterium]
MLNIGVVYGQQTGLSVAVFGGTTFTNAFGKAKPDFLNDGIVESKYLRPDFGYTFGVTLQYDLTTRIALRGSYGWDQKIVKSTGDAFNQFGEKMGTYVLDYKHSFNTANIAVQYAVYRNRASAYCTLGFFTSFLPRNDDRIFFESELMVNGSVNTFNQSIRPFTMHGGIMSGAGLKYLLGKKLGINLELMTYTTISNYNNAGNRKKYNMPFGIHGTLGLSYLLLTNATK